MLSFINFPPMALLARPRRIVVRTIAFVYRALDDRKSTFASPGGSAVAPAIKITFDIHPTPGTIFPRERTPSIAASFVFVIQTPVVQPMGPSGHLVLASIVIVVHRVVVFGIRIWTVLFFAVAAATAVTAHRLEGQHLFALQFGVQKKIQTNFKFITSGSPRRIGGRSLRPSRRKIRARR